MQQIGDVIKSSGRVNPCNFGGDASIDVSNILLLSHLSLPVLYIKHSISYKKHALWFWTMVLFYQPLFTWHLEKCLNVGMKGVMSWKCHQLKTILLMCLCCLGNAILQNIWKLWKLSIFCFRLNHPTIVENHEGKQRTLILCSTR